MIAEIAYYQILGNPVVFWLGLTGLVLLLLTPVFVKIKKKSVKWHQTAAILATIFALVHAALAYFS